MDMKYFSNLLNDYEALIIETFRNLEIVVNLHSSDSSAVYCISHVVYIYEEFHQVEL